MVPRKIPASIPRSFPARGTPEINKAFAFPQRCPPISFLCQGFPSANVAPYQRRETKFTVEDAATTCDSHFTSAPTSKFAFGSPNPALRGATWKHLCSHTFLPHEAVYLIEGIFTNKDEVKMICDLRGDDAQIFIDVIHKVCLVPLPPEWQSNSLTPFALPPSSCVVQVLHLPDLPTRLWGKCLSALCRICSRQAVLPKSLQIPICYNRLGTPLYRGGFADVWKGEYEGCEVAVKVLRVYSTSDIAKVTSVSCQGFLKLCN